MANEFDNLNNPDISKTAVFVASDLKNIDKFKRFPSGKENKASSKTKAENFAEKGGIKSMPSGKIAASGKAKSNQAHKIGKAIKGFAVEVIPPVVGAAVNFAVNSVGAISGVPAAPIAAASGAAVTGLLKRAFGEKNDR